MDNLLILGAGQYGVVVKEIAEAIGEFDELSFLDDNSPKAIDRIEECIKYSDKYSKAVVAIGNTEKRLELIRMLEYIGFNVVTLIHPLAYVSPSAIIEKGSFVEPMAVIHAGVKIGTGCIISAGTIINHDAIINDGCHLNCGTIVGASAVIKPGIKSDYGQKLQ